MIRKAVCSLLFLAGSVTSAYSADIAEEKALKVAGEKTPFYSITKRVNVPRPDLNQSCEVITVTAKGTPICRLITSKQVESQNGYPTYDVNVAWSAFHMNGTHQILRNAPNASAWSTPNFNSQLNLAGVTNTDGKGYVLNQATGENTVFRSYTTTRPAQSDGDVVAIVSGTGVHAWFAGQKGLNMLLMSPQGFYNSGPIVISPNGEYIATLFAKTVFTPPASSTYVSMVRIYQKNAAGDDYDFKDCKELVGPMGLVAINDRGQWIGSINQTVISASYNKPGIKTVLQMANPVQIATNGWILAQTYSVNKGDGLGISEPVLILNSGKVVRLMDQLVSSDELLYPSAAGMSQSGARIALNAYDRNLGRRTGLIVDFQDFEK
jgi:hypothetical protein